MTTKQDSLGPLDPVISRADTRDLPEILRLQKLAFETEAARYGDWSIPPLTQTLEDITLEYSRALFLKAVINGSLVGSARAFLKDGVCHIGRVIVDPALQGHGIGKRIMAAIEAEFPAALRFELFTGDRSERNLGFYGKLGYTPFQTTQVTPDMALVYLEKRRETQLNGRSESDSGMV